MAARPLWPEVGAASAAGRAAPGSPCVAAAAPAIDSLAAWQPHEDPAGEPRTSAADIEEWELIFNMYFYRELYNNDLNTMSGQKGWFAMDIFIWNGNIQCTFAYMLVLLSSV